MSSPGNFARHQIHIDILALKLEDLIHPPPAEQRPDACEQLGKGKWLDEIIVSAPVQSQYPVLNRVLRCEDEHRRLNAALAQGSENIDAVALRQHEIEQHEI